jgi:hypothetical protein
VNNLLRNRGAGSVEGSKESIENPNKWRVLAKECSILRSRSVLTVHKKDVRSDQVQSLNLSRAIDKTSDRQGEPAGVPAFNNTFGKRELSCSYQQTVARNEKVDY